MKRILLGLFTLTAVTFGANAQVFTTPHDTVNFTYSSGIIDVHNDITVPGAGNVSLTWSVVAENFSADNTWKTDNGISICDNSNCYTNIGQGILGGNTYTTTYYADSTDIFKATFNLAGANPGIRYVTINIKDDNSSYNKNITFMVSKWATGVNSVSKNSDDITLYPNPVRDEVNVVFNGMDVKNIAVYNVIGKNMIVYRTSGSSAKLDISKFPGGVYFLRMSDAKGAIVATKRITKQ